jgi:hypothetical protein
MGVIPMPPATNSTARSAANGNALTGPVTRSSVPGLSVSWISVDPPPPPSIRRTAIRYVPRSAGSPFRE